MLTGRVHLLAVKQVVSSHPHLLALPLWSSSIDVVIISHPVTLLSVLPFCSWMLFCIRLRLARLGSCGRVHGNCLVGLLCAAQRMEQAA